MARHLFVWKLTDILAKMYLHKTFGKNSTFLNLFFFTFKNLLRLFAIFIEETDLLLRFVITIYDIKAVNTDVDTLVIVTYIL